MKIGNYETHPAADVFPMLDEAQLDSLARDIRAHGLKHPIMRLDGKILDGRNRLSACLRAGVEPRFAEHGEGNPWLTVWSLNAERRQIEDKIRLVLIREEINVGADAHDERKRKAQEEANRARSEAARGNQNAAKNSRASHEAPPTPLPPVRDNAVKEARKSATALAAQTGVSRATVERALALKMKAPEQAERVKAGEVVGAIALKEVRRAEVVARVAATPAALPLDSVRPCPVVYADPPWSYDNTSSAGAVADQYGTMPLAAICALKPPATKDAVLFMWATSPLLPEAFEVLRAWGFTYKASLVWDKGSGTGNWVLNAHELLLIAVRGNIPCPLPSNRPVSVVSVPRGKHSAKPKEFAALIRRMYPEFERVEMFCREPSEGFASWGNEVAA